MYSIFYSILVLFQISNLIMGESVNLHEYVNNTIYNTDINVLIGLTYFSMAYNYVSK